MVGESDDEESDDFDPENLRNIFLNPGILTKAEENEERRKILLEASTIQESFDKRKTDNADLMALVKEVLSKGRNASHRIFHNDLIGTLPSVVENEPIFHAGSLVDAGARIYSYKVDAAHSEVYEFRCQLCGGKSKSSGTLLIKDKNADENEEQIIQDVAKRTKNRVQQGDDSVYGEEGSDTELNQVGGSTVRLDDYPVKHFENERAIRFGEQLTESEIIGILRKRVDRFHVQNAQRRAKITNLATICKELDRLEASSTLYSHVYYKAIRKFDEGSVNGLLMQNALVSEDGKHYLLHDSRYNADELRVRAVDGSALRVLFDVMESAEKVHLESWRNVTTSTSNYNMSKQYSSQEFSLFEVPRNDRNCADDAKDAAERLINDLSTERACDFIFQWRRDLQKRHSMTSGQCIKYLISCIIELRPFIMHDIARKLLLPPRRRRIDVCRIHIESGFRSTILAKQLVPFEETMEWTVHWRMIGRTNHDVSSAAGSLKNESKQTSALNYFFAHPRTSLWENQNCCSNVDPDFWNSEYVLISDVMPFCEVPFANALQTYKQSRDGGLFSLIGQEFADAVSSTTMVITSNGANGRKAVRGGSIHFDGGSQPPEIFDEEIYSNVSRKDMSDIDQNLDVECDFFELADVDGNSVQAEGSVEKSPGVESDHVLDCVDNVTQLGDLNYGKETEICNVNASIIQDDTHWKQDRKNDGECAVKKRRINAKQAEHMHAESSCASAAWDWIEFDEMPLHIIRKRLLKSKHVHDLSLSDSRLFSGPSNISENGPEYYSERFKHAAHLISKNWNVANGMNVHERRKHSNNLFDGKGEVNDIERLFFEHMETYRHYFDSLYDVESEHPGNSESSDEFQFERNSGSSHTDNGAEGHKCPDILLSNDDSLTDDGLRVKMIFKRQCIDPSAVKQAIGAIMCDSRLDAISLNKEIATARALNLIGDEVSEVDILEHNFESRSNASDLESISDKATASGSSTIHDTYGTNATLKNFKLRGHHTFSSILAHLPSRLANSTPDHLNPITAFSVLLHICNENDIMLIQKCDADDDAISYELDDFTIILAGEKQSKPRKRSHR